MSKKGKGSKQQASSKKRPPVKGKKKSPLIWIAGAAVLVVILMMASGNNPFSGQETPKGKSFSVQGGETRPVLDASQFQGYARAAYAAAARYPEVLDQVYCYCECDRPPTYHKSLLSCFTDRHGAG